MDDLKRTLETFSGFESSHALLASFLARIPVALQICRPDGSCLLVNHAYRALFLCEPAADYNLFRDDSAAVRAVRGAAQRALAGETVRTPTIWFETGEGRVAVSATTFPLRSQRGDVELIVMVFDDETEGIDAHEALLKERDRLRMSEAHLEAAQRLTRCGSWEVDASIPGGTLVRHWSSEVFRIIGRDPRTTPASREIFYQAAHPDDSEMIRTAFRDAVENRREFNIEHRIVRPDGTVRIVRNRSEMRMDEAGVRRLIGTMQDVTEQREAEATIRRSGEWLQMALEAGRLIAWELDFATGALAVSDGASRLLGLDPQASFDNVKSVLALVHEEDRVLVNAALMQALGEGEAPDLRFRMVRPDSGEVVWLETRGRVIRDGENQIVGVRGMGSDITVGKRAEEELRTSEARFRTLVEHASEGTSVMNLDSGKWVDINPVAERLFGVERERLLQMNPITDFSPPRQPDGRTSQEAGRAYMEMAMAGESPVFEWVHLNAAGETIPCEVRLVRLPSTEGRLVRASIIDIRDRKRVEELHARSADLENQNRRIAATSRLKSEFLANMSHELRTPLNAIIGFAELLHDGVVPPGSPEHREFLHDILISGRHLHALINDILDLSKIEAGKLEFHPEPVDIAALVDEVRTVLRASLADKNLRIEARVDPALEEIVLDPARFKQVLYNYLSNAVKFTPEGGRIAVRASVVDTNLFRVEVEDTGIGIAARDISRLFNEFEQLDAGARKRHGGTGLGLALTRRLVEAQGGSVGVRSVQGEGSVFHAILPRRVQKDGRTPRRAPVTRSGRMSVLVVEDDVRDSALIAGTLERGGYSVETARTGAEARALCEERSFDAITLDLLLPDMNGIELLARLRSSGRNRSVPVFVITIVMDRRWVAGFTVQDVLQKPLDGKALLAALERAGLKPDISGSILVVDDDARSRRLMKAALSKLGHRVVTRASGEAGLSAALKLRPRAIILDITMPGMDGFEFLSRLRANPEHAATPVIVWTGRDLTAAECERLHECAHAIIAKGNEMDALPALLDAALYTGAGVEK